MPTPEPRALLIAPATPSRSGNGLAMRLSLFHDALSRVARLDTVVLPISGPPPGDRFAAEFGSQAATVPVTGRLDTQFRLLQLIADPKERLEQFRRYGRGSRHAFLSQPVLNDVRNLLARSDYRLVHVARLYLAEAVSGLRTATTLDLDEDDAWAWRRLAETQPGGEGAWSMAEAEAEDRLLGRCGGAFDARFVSGPADRDTLASRHPDLTFETVANAIVFPKTLERRDDGRTLLFVGAFGYRPNVEGVLWFVREVWPRIRAQSPAGLRLVGRDAPQAIRLLDGRDGIEVAGPLEDIGLAYPEATLAIAPLQTGGGTRLKLIEAGAHLVPIVATPLAARGLEFIGPDTAWLADEPEAFAGAVLAVLADKAERERRAALAHELARRTHDREDVVERLARRFALVLEGDKGGGRAG